MEQTLFSSQLWPWVLYDWNGACGSAWGETLEMRPILCLVSRYKRLFVGLRDGQGQAHGDREWFLGTVFCFGVSRSHAFHNKPELNLGV